MKVGAEHMAQRHPQVKRPDHPMGSPEAWRAIHPCERADDFVVSVNALALPVGADSEDSSLFSWEYRDDRSLTDWLSRTVMASRRCPEDGKSSGGSSSTAIHRQRAAGFLSSRGK
jgi:uncharacterized protein YbaA (DUF1428 family)